MFHDMISIYVKKSQKLLQCLLKTIIEEVSVQAKIFLEMGEKGIEDSNQERSSWSCLVQTCSRSLIVFLSQFLDGLLNVFDSF